MKAKFASEAALCAAFLAAIDRRAWTPYAETAGWDILLVRKDDGFQIGIQAKLKLNAHVIAQAIEEYGSWAADYPGPDCRAVLVPEGDVANFKRIAAYVGITIIRFTRLVRERNVRGGYAFMPQLPGTDSATEHWAKDWHEWAPSARHKLPEYVPDVPAGMKSPLQLTQWKIGAIKLALMMERNGHLTRADFKHLHIDHRRWIAPGSGWLKRDGDRFVCGPHFPDVRSKHPTVTAQIEADAEHWMPSKLPLFAKAS